ncbi:hypothetical protein [Clavibacter michiganensis]|uniref:Uncharacterized protein n=1 Tax=Clavibacter michiganensis subsp. insidiosus TaxID=33014 RepID=A0A0D5CN83_9MICO|nr:hypothetical protein [Clavibacter michiganensis]AJW80747.1 hypothetical protein VO01_16070 [Clavibacter michiganensis subsp. insidiosus]AWF99948.1 hypothetical protein BEH61_15690 [Clavibacter michiganensis subsp. insidiosus]RII84882.1 hypothetical protein DZF92_16640 [Clavibacter michiganensis subsp. insidiosus]RIJ45046.1 hypothetical protein DZF93_00450 [Clavibacter michiganensis subsp. insidiosus]
MTPLPNESTVDLLVRTISERSREDLEMIRRIEMAKRDWAHPALRKVAALVPASSSIVYVTGMSECTSEGAPGNPSQRAAGAIVVITDDLVVACTFTADADLATKSEVTAWPRTALATLTVTKAQPPREAAGDGQGSTADAVAVLTMATGMKLRVPIEGNGTPDPALYQALPKLLRFTS